MNVCYVVHAECLIFTNVSRGAALNGFNPKSGSTNQSLLESGAGYWWPKLAAWSGASKQGGRRLMLSEDRRMSIRRLRTKEQRLNQRSVQPAGMARVHLSKAIGTTKDEWWIKARNYDPAVMVNSVRYGY